MNYERIRFPKKNKSYRQIERIVKGFANHRRIQILELLQSEILENIRIVSIERGKLKIIINPEYLIKSKR